MTSSLKRIESLVERFAGFAIARQVICPGSFPTLDALAGRSVSRSGTLIIEGQRVAFNEVEPSLAKLGLVGDILVTARDHEDTLVRTREKAVRLTLASKVRRRLLGDDGHKGARLAGYLGARWRRLRYPPISSPGSAKDRAWAFVPGLNFLREADGSWRCTDHGAIYEDFLVGRDLRYPSQVGADLYTSSCALAVFDHMALNTGEARWFEAIAAGQSYISNLAAHRRQRLEHDHREFDYAPIVKALGSGKAGQFGGWTDYDPVNVFALRYYNLALSADSAKTRALRRTCLQVVRRNQTAEGMIQDNFGGNTIDSVDLTYHQYALAMLCLGNTILRDPRADAVILKALQYSRREALRDGQATYYGRGANNIYHLASFVTALAYGSTHLGIEADVEIGRSVGRLEAYQRSDGSWPTAMNNAPAAEMMGWHGSAAQYGALTAWLLAEAAALLARPRAAGHYQPSPKPSRGRVRHIVLRNERIELGLTDGGAPVPWCEGIHGSGLAGITALTVDSQSALLTADRLCEPGSPPTWVSDTGEQGPRARKWMTVSSDNVRLDIQDRGSKATFLYSLHDEGFEVSVRAKGQACHALALQGPVTISETLPHRIVLAASSGLRIVVTSIQAIEASLHDVPVNPQGPGTLCRIASEATDAAFCYEFTWTSKPSSEVQVKSIVE